MTEPEARTTSESLAVSPTRVLVIAVGGELNQSTRLRILQYLPALIQEGFSFETYFVSADSRGLDLDEISSRVDRADVVFVQRVLDSGLIRLLRQASVPVVYDLDDALHYIRPQQYARTVAPLGLFDHFTGAGRVILRGGRYYSGRRKKLNEMIDLARVVIVGNDWLFDDLALDGGSSVVLPTSVWVEGAPCKVHRNHWPVTLGWIGGWGSLYNLHLIDEVFDVLRQKFAEQIELKIVSSGPRETALVTRFQQWSLETEDEDVMSFDIGLMPVPNDPFSQGKCAFKAIYCMSRGVPVVVSPVGANTDLISHGMDGFLAATAQEWIQALSQLIGDVELRTRMGRLARRTVEERYSATSVATGLKAVLLRASTSV